VEEEPPVIPAVVIPVAVIPPVVIPAECN